MLWIAIFLLEFLARTIGASKETNNYGSCYRECDTVPMTCEYEFNITLETTMNMNCLNCPFVAEDCLNEGCITAGGNIKTVTVANYMIPGPPIVVCENDTVIVNVQNMLLTDTISIHWHGIHQVGSFFMDGLPQISQYPIFPLDRFVYNFTASPAGTHMWHSHSSFQESDGLYGAFIVRRKEPISVSSLYDFDLPEHIITVWHWYDRPTTDVLTSILHRNGSVNGYGLLINGKGGHVKFHINNTIITTPREQFNVKKGFRYRFRLIHNSAIYCPIQMSIDKHTMKVIASETSFIEPLEVDTLMVGAGDRFDFVLKTFENEGCYTMRFRAIGDCGEDKTKVNEIAFLCYDNSSLPSFYTHSYGEADRNGILLNPNEVATYDYSNKSLVFLTDLNSTENEQNIFSGEPNVTLYVQIHSRNYDSARFPGAWHQFDNISFMYPGVSFLENKFESPEVCTRENKDKFCQDDFCKCTYLQKLPKDSLVEIVFVDITLNRNQDHPVHLHGYKFYILSMGLLGTNETLDDIKYKNENDLITKNLKNPVSKDTVSVPNKGYAIVRFLANNPGFWLLHCHITNHMELGMAMILQIGSPEEILTMCHKAQQCGPWYKGSSVELKNQSFILTLAFSIIVFYLS
ncbi:unnamed protein product [Nezara viridula]|uniref:Uncharacterized protein n=1 Tax=Nezara viridula TaxID=85310 RepID=A0A9P0HC61_NEZVI|nr:unnamed protein product [Nezara viridula]